ncbi:MAG: enoyl-CoA hydratase-related protein [Bdellovibrionales bacterium]
MKHLKVTENQSIVTVALNRPEKRNAFHPDMIAEISTCFAQLNRDERLRAVILTGEGESFCAGGDLAWMKSMADYTLLENIDDAGRLFDMYAAIFECPVPVIGHVFGHCFGGGAGLVAVCDMVAAESSTQFCFSEVKWGLVPAVISPFVTARAKAAFVREWFFTAKVFMADEAVSGGLVNFSGTRGDIDRYVENLAKSILAAAPQAVRESKLLQNSYVGYDWPLIRARVTKLIAERRVSDEGQSGLKAFLEKRQPQWSSPPYGQPPKV